MFPRAHFRFTLLRGPRRLLLREPVIVSDDSAKNHSAGGPQEDPRASQEGEALAELQSRYEALAENTLDLLSELDEAGNFIYLSPMHRETLGWEADAYLGTSAFDVIHPDDRQGAWDELQRALQAGFANATLRVRKADGSWRWFECAGRTRRTAAGEQRLVLISRDVHDRIMAERRLQRQQRSLKQMLDLRDRDHRLLAHEIHDGLTQDLTGALLYVESAEAINGDPERRTALAHRQTVAPRRHQRSAAADQRPASACAGRPWGRGRHPAFD